MAASLAMAALLALPSSAFATYVVIDPGHGGPLFSGAVGNGLYEKNANLQIALSLGQALEATGCKVGFTRTTDAAVTTYDIPTWHWGSDGLPRLSKDGYYDVSDDLQGRVDVANRAGADLFVSIHNNWYDSTRTVGTETYAASTDALGRQLSLLVQRSVVGKMGVVDRGAKTAGFYVLRWSNMPAILVECGFISSPLDVSRLKSATWRSRFATAVADGIARFGATSPFKPVYPRLAGDDRYTTAAALSRKGWPTGASTVLLANGLDWPDAIAAAPLSRKLDAPLLFTQPNDLPRKTAAEITRLHPSKIIVLGAPAFVSSAVGTAAVAAAAAGGGKALVTRIAGRDRYGTAALIAERVGVPGDGRIAIVSGTTFVNALSLGPYAGMAKMPVLLANGGRSLPASEAAFVAKHRAAIRGVLVVGYTNSVPASVVTGLPGVKRIYGTTQWSTNTAVATLFGGSSVSPLVVNAAAYHDGIAAAAYGAKARRPVLLVGQRMLPDPAHAFVELNASRIPSFGMVGNAKQVANVVEWELKKAKS
jgi:N-acetylmuramoyl-L-alanine amidase/putative cell wall-binding protein